MTYTLCNKNEFIHLIFGIVSSIEYNLWINPRRHTASNDFSTSKHTKPTIWFKFASRKGGHGGTHRADFALVEFSYLKLPILGYILYSIA